MKRNAAPPAQEPLCRTPFSEHDERALLGCLLIQNDLLPTVAELLAPEDFFQVHFRTIYECMLAFAERHETFDVFAIQNYLRRAPDLMIALYASNHGLMLLTNLMEEVTSTALIAQHATVIRNMARRRALLAQADEIALLALNPEVPDEELLPLSEERLAAVDAGRAQTANWSTLGVLARLEMEALEARKAAGPRITGVPTGITDLDWQLLGLQPQDLILIAGRPGMGKSALGVQLALHAAAQKLPTAFFSLEMPARQIVMRALCSEGRVDSYHFRHGFVTHEDWARLGAAAVRLSNVPFFLDESRALTVSNLRAKCRSLHAKCPLSLVVVDYLQILAPTQPSRDEARDIGQISTDLKTLAAELNVPVVALAMIGRSVEARPSKVPLLSDLRGSGRLEADADVVLFPFRPDYYKRKDTRADDDAPEPPPGMERAELHVAKHRNGATGMIDCWFSAATGRFEGLHEEPVETPSPVPALRVVTTVPPAQTAAPYWADVEDQEERPGRDTGVIDTPSAPHLTQEETDPFADECVVDNHTWEY